MLGLISGVLVGVVIILFRLLIEMAQSGILPAGNPDDFESLSWQVRILLSSVGGLVLGLLFYFASATVPRVGIIHVLERLAYHEGHLPVKNMLLQFFGGAIAIISGHSVGREGQVSTLVRRVPVYWVRNCACLTIVFVCLSLVVQLLPLLPHLIPRWPV